MAKNPADDVLFEVAGGDQVPVTKSPAGRSKTFRHYDPTQSFLLPPSLDDWLPEDHTARFIAEVVDNLLDLSTIYDSYVESMGAPPYDPSMMLKLLLFAYSTGVTSSREMERRCYVDVAFRWLSANTSPDYRSISRFRRRHLVAVDDLFTQVLTLCAEAGLVKLGRVALDGTKLRASASRHNAMSYDRLGPKIEQLGAEAIGGELLPMGSAGAKAMAVVRGDADIYLHTGGQYEWDSCAPVTVAAAAGLHVSRADGRILVYNRPDPWIPDLLICQPALAGAVLAAVRAGSPTG